MLDYVLFPSFVVQFFVLHGMVLVSHIFVASTDLTKNH